MAANPVTRAVTHFTEGQKVLLKSYFHEKGINSCHKGHMAAIQEISEQLKCSVKKVKVC